MRIVVFEGVIRMKESQLSLSEFASEEGFELNSYLTSLFEYISSLSKNEGVKFEPTSDFTKLSNNGIRRNQIANIFCSNAIKGRF